MEIAVSYLGIKENLSENIDKLISSGIDYLHVDVMDGKFVSNKTNNIIDILKTKKVKFDVHLMVEDIIYYIDLYKEINPVYITFHYEVNCDIKKIINYIKSLNIKVGLSIKPDTNIDEITAYLKDIDLVLLMSVEPGMGGQKYIDISHKIKTIKEYDVKIEVDGGINDKNISLIDADIFVVGSFVTNYNYKKQIDILKEKIYG